MINDPTLDFETVCKWSQLIAQLLGIPSRFDKKTSLGMPLGLLKSQAKLIKRIEVDVVLALGGLGIGNFVRSNFNGGEKVHILRP